MKNAILGKCNVITPDRLELILEKINPNRKYVIKATNCPVKFLNIVSAETIAYQGRRALSETSALYGEFTPGRFSNFEGNKIMLSSSMDPAVPAAAVKRSFDNQIFGQTVMTYTLVIYEPHM